MLQMFLLILDWKILSLYNFLLFKKKINTIDSFLKSKLFF